MRLEELMATLETLEKGEEMKECVNDLLKEARTEAAKHRKEKSKAKEELEKATEELEELKSKFNELEPKGTGAKAVKTLQEQLNELKTQLDKANEERETERQKRVQADMMSQAVDALTKANAIDPQEFAKLIIPNILVNEDGSFMYQLEDGNQASIAEGVTSWLNARPWGVRDTQVAGSGRGQSHPNGNMNQGATSLQEAIAQAIKQ